MKPSSSVSILGFGRKVSIENKKGFFFLLKSQHFFFTLWESKQLQTWSSEKKTPIFLISLKFSICWAGLPANKDPGLCPPPSHFCWNSPSSWWDVTAWKLSGQWFPRREIHGGLKTNHLKVVTAACHSLHAHHKLALANQVWLTFF